MDGIIRWIGKDVAPQLGPTTMRQTGLGIGRFLQFLTVAGAKS